MSLKLPSFLYKTVPYVYMLGGGALMYEFRGWLGGWITGIVGLALITYGLALLLLRNDFQEQSKSDGPASRYDDSRFDDVRVQSGLISSKASKNKGPISRKKP
jgi:hypothetical protein